jgi:hypothetical protein
MFNPALLQHALSVTSVDRLIFSTDYPFQQPSRTDIGTFLDNFAPEDRLKLGSANAAALFSIDLQSTNPAAPASQPSDRPSST